VSTFSSFDGTTLAYETSGSPGERPPVILLHGFAADSNANWVLPGVVGALVGAGRYVVAPDARGHGRSQKPHDPEAYAGDAMVRDARSLIDHLGADQVDVCGYSMGALTTYALAASEPRVRSAVLGGMGAQLGSRSMAERAPRIADALLADDPDTITNPVAKAFRAFADSTGADRRALAAIQRSARAPMADGTAITVPTMVIVGDADTLVGSPQELASRIPRATVEVVSGDHLTAVFDPRFATAIVAFFDRVDHRAGG
jgi:pimeloyl-ACP methyl ester carboxylesterase